MGMLTKKITEMKPHQSDKEVIELTIEFELIVPDMEFNSCWHLENWLVKSSTYTKR
jgi:hypothetical protein